MAIERRDPLQDVARLHDQVNRLFEEVLADGPAPGPARQAGGPWRPALDLVEEPERFVLRADLPGVEPADVEIRVENDRLVVRGARRDEAARPESSLRVERPAGAFRAEVTLPRVVDRERIEARQRNGVLRIDLPKRAARAASTISVEG